MSRRTISHCRPAKGLGSGVSASMKARERASMASAR
jgi:hypothetical protein